MKKSIISAIALFSATSLFAQTEVMKIELTNGTFQTISIEDIKEVTFETTETSGIAGTYTGVNTVVVGGQFTYTANTDVVITANEDGTINYTWNEYSLAGTVMGDLTLGKVTIPDIPYNEEKGGYYLDYSDLGLIQHFTAISGGTASMDKDYVLDSPSTILITKTENGIMVENPFKLGAMPLPISSSFTGSK